MAKGRKTTKKPAISKAKAYNHTEAESPMRPDVGTQPQFKKKKPPVLFAAS